MKRVLQVLLVLGLLIGMVGCDDSEKKHEVHFYDINSTNYLTKEVENGLYVIDEVAPEVEGYQFVGWLYKEEIVEQVMVEDTVELFACYKTKEIGWADYQIVGAEEEQFVELGETTSLYWGITPEGYDGPITIRSNDESILKVNEDNTVTGVAAGSSVVTIELVNSGIEILVNVIDPNNPIVEDEYALASDEYVYLKLNGTSQIKMAIQSNDPQTKQVTYSSDDIKVATVDSNGVIKAVGYGNTAIRVTSKNKLHERLVFVYVTGLVLEANPVKPDYKYKSGEIIEMYLNFTEYTKTGVVTVNGYSAPGLKIVIEEGQEYVEVDGHNVKVIKSADAVVKLHYETNGTISNTVTIQIEG